MFLEKDIMSGEIRQFRDESPLSSLMLYTISTRVGI